MKYFTQANLEKIEEIFKTLGYILRYEKGNFRTGACYLVHTKVVVVNKFSTVDIKISSLLSILEEMEIDLTKLNDTQRLFLGQIQGSKVKY